MQNPTYLGVNISKVEKQGVKEQFFKRTREERCTIPGLNCSESALFIEIPTPSITARIMPPATKMYMYDIIRYNHHLLDEP